MPYNKEAGRTRTGWIELSIPSSIQALFGMAGWAGWAWQATLQEKEAGRKEGERITSGRPLVVSSWALCGRLCGSGSLATHTPPLPISSSQAFDISISLIKTKRKEELWHSDTHSTLFRCFHFRHFSASEESSQAKNFQMAGWLRLGRDHPPCVCCMCAYGGLGQGGGRGMLRLHLWQASIHLLTGEKRGEDFLPATPIQSEWAASFLSLRLSVAC